MCSTLWPHNDRTALCLRDGDGVKPARPGEPYQKLAGVYGGWVILWSLAKLELNVFVIGNLNFTLESNH